MMLLGHLTAGGEGVLTLIAEVVGGVALGIVLPWLAVRLVQIRFFAAAPLYQPLGVVAVALLLLSSAALSHANEFLAAFTGGITLVSSAPAVREIFRDLGEALTELLKLASLLLFGALASRSLFTGLDAGDLVFAALALLAVRPAALAVALVGGGLSRREWIAAAWFGPKGFASVLYGLFILHSGVDRAEDVFRSIALVVTGSIVAHSSTDVLIARWFRRTEGR